MDQQQKTGGSRILIMDDDEMIRYIAEQNLERMGHEVVCVADGAAALEEFGNACREGKPFRAIFLDLNIHGGMGGRETMKRVLELDPNIKGFAMSGNPTDPVMQEFAAHGFHGVIDKHLLYRREQMESLLHSLGQPHSQ